MECVNLKERYGKKYRVRYEESYHAQYGPRAFTVDPWLIIIPCHYGHLFPHGGDVLAASTDRRGTISRRLTALPGLTVHQDGDDGVTVLFHVDQFDAVAEVMKPRRRRVVSEAERERLRTMGFKPLAHYGAPETSAVCVPMGSDDSEAVQGQSNALALSGV